MAVDIYKDGGRPAKRERTNFNSIVTILVGTEERSFVVHRDIIRNTSDFLRAATNEYWQEGKEKVIRLPEQCSTAFEIYLHWLYHGVVDLWNGLADENKPMRVPRNGKTYTLVGPRYHRIVGCWVLRDMLGDRRCCNALVESWFALGTETWLVPHWSEVNAIFEATSEGSEIRELAADELSFATHHDTIKEQLPKYGAQAWKAIALAAVLQKSTSPASNTPTNRGSCYYHIHLAAGNDGGRCPEHQEVKAEYEKDAFVIVVLAGACGLPTLEQCPRRILADEDNYDVANGERVKSGVEVKPRGRPDTMDVTSFIESYEADIEFIVQAPSNLGRVSEVNTEVLEYLHFAMDAGYIYIGIPLAILLILAIIDGSVRAPKGARYPPGPSRKPLIGNLLDIPPTHSWIQFKKWADEYNTKILGLTFAGRPHYVLSSEKVANDLLRERGSIYSSRPLAPASSELLSRNLRPVLLPYNDVWRNGRKFMHQVANANIVSNYHATQELESTRMVAGLIKEPHRYEHWFQLYSAAVIFRLAFGRVIETGDEDVVKKINDVNHHLERVASPGAYLVDAFPILMKLPKFLAPFKRELDELHDREHSLFRGLLEDVRDRMKSGSAPKCWERDFLENQEDLHLTDDQGAYVVGTMFEAGSGTTSAAMMSFMLAMVLHPLWFKMLQAEVDELSEDRLPCLDDIPELPTIRAAVKEVLRWRPVTAGGLPHVCTKDDTYEGTFIPAGTVLHPNQWAIHRDPELYPRPETYNPQRWLDPSFPTYREPLTEYPNLHNFSSFGHGRRICPGQHIAERNLYLLAARIAWSVDLAKAKDKDGEDITPPLYHYTAGFNSQPEYFPFTAKVRSPQRQAIIDAELKKNAENDPLA